MTTPIDQKVRHYAVQFDSLPNEHYIEGLSVKNQNPGDTCVSHGLLGPLELMAKNNGTILSLSRKFHYGVSLDNADKLADDNGMQLSRGVQTVMDEGVCLENTVPYLPPFNVIPFQAAYDEAINNRAKDAQWLYQSGDSQSASQRLLKLKSALCEGLPVTVNMGVTEQIKGLTGPWEQHAYLKINNVFNPVSYAHTFIIDGYKGNMLRCMNSYGQFSGDGGRIGLPWWIVSEPYSEMMIIRSFRDWSVPEKAGIITEINDRYNLDIRIVPEERFIDENVDMYVTAIDDNGIVLALTPSGVVNTGKTVEEITDIPVFKTLTLDGTKYVEILEGLDLEPFSGQTLYIGYGSLDDLVYEAITL